MGNGDLLVMWQEMMKRVVITGKEVKGIMLITKSVNMKTRTKTKKRRRSPRLSQFPA